MISHPPAHQNINQLHLAQQAQHQKSHNALINQPKMPLLHHQQQQFQPPFTSNVSNCGKKLKVKTRKQKNSSIKLSNFRLFKSFNAKHNIL